MKQKNKIQLVVSKNCVTQAINQMEQRLSSNEIYQNQKGKIHIILEEILSNISKFAYPSGAGKIIVYFKIIHRKSILKLCFVDWGISFNPINRPFPDIETSVEDKQIGGLGIYMVLKLAKQVKYKRRFFKNILCIKIG